MYPELNKYEELERFKKAADRLVQRAESDPQVARGLLRDIGFYTITGQADPDKNAGNGSSASLRTLEK